MKRKHKAETVSKNNKINVLQFWTDASNGLLI